MTSLDEIVLSKECYLKMIPRLHRGDPAFIPIRISGGIGDAIASRFTLRFLQTLGFNIAAWTPHAEALKYFDPSLPVNAGPIPNFTWHLDLASVAKFVISECFSGFMVTEHRRLFEAQQRLFKECPYLEKLTREYPNYNYLLSRYAKDKSLTRLSFPLHSIGYESDLKTNPARRKSLHPVITLHDGFDVSNFNPDYPVSTKQWGLWQWKRLVKKLKFYYPDYKIIQLGSNTSRPIDGVDECLINQTSLHQAFDLLSQSGLHIDGDSGLVHAATALNIPCVVLFGPTPDYFYKYPQNINLISQSMCSGGCYWLDPSWMKRCPIGYETPRCMDSISVDRVFEAAHEFLQTKRP